MNVLQPARLGRTSSASSTAGSAPGWPGTAAALREILLTDPSCRRRWQRHAQRSGSQLPNQSGVAWVLALALWDRGDVAESRRALPRSLKDRVSRALNGQLISASTLALFVEAFDLSEDQEQTLYAAWETDAAAQAEVGQPADT